MIRLLILSLCALSLMAQSWEPVRGLIPGARVKVRETNGPEHKGAVAAVTPDVISLKTAKGDISVDRARVNRVQIHRSSRRVRNIAIGAAIGLGIAITVDQTLGALLRNEGHDSARAITYIAPIGIFGAIGAAMSPYKTIYRAP
jgi:hypothetical protein